MKTYQIAVIKGDGIGPEVCEATVEVACTDSTGKLVRIPEMLKAALATSS